MTVATCAAVAARYWRRGTTQGRGVVRPKPRVVALKGHDHGESGHSHGEAMGHSHDSHAEHGGHSHDGHSHAGHSEAHSHDVHSHDTHSAEHSHDSHGHSHGCCGGLGHGHSHGEVPEWLPGRRRLQRLMATRCMDFRRISGLTWLEVLYLRMKYGNAGRNWPWFCFSSCVAFQLW